MLLCRVHNLTTDQRYEFRAADQAEIDARLERKATTYGRAAWTETIPAWTDTTADPPVDHPEQVIEHLSERTVEVVNIDAALAAETEEAQALTGARAYFRDLDWQRIGDSETRRALKHLWRVVKRLDR